MVKSGKISAEETVRHIRRETRRKYNAALRLRVPLSARFSAYISYCFFCTRYFHLGCHLISPCFAFSQMGNHLLILVLDLSHWR
jgi:hypothetical protein